MSNEYHFTVLFHLTSAENAKEVKVKSFNYLVYKTSSFLNIQSIICFPLLIGRFFDPEADQF